MKKQMNVKSRRELLGLLSERYGSGSQATKCQVLDEFVAVTGYHRNHAIRVLKLRPGEDAHVVKARPRRYGDAVVETLLILWEASDRVCGKRLKALVPILLESLETHGHLSLDSVLRDKVLSASAATIDRMLTTARNASGAGHRQRKGAINTLRRTVPVRTFADWKDPAPGYVEADLVSPSGPNASGSFAQTLTLTDVASGWTECVALVVRDGALVTEALTKLRKVMPFCLRGLDTDNGTEFMNDIVIAYCRDNDIEQTRSRPYRK